MKKYFTTTIAIMMLMAVATITAEAQAFGSQEIRARIPFAFTAGKTEFPAGKYTVTVLNRNSDRKVLQIKSAGGKLSALIQTGELNATASDETKLVFNRYGSRYFFAQAQMAGESTTLAAVKSTAERNEEHALASKRRKATITIIAE